MATNNARARAAREYVKAHPGIKYTEALRMVSEENLPKTTELQLAHGSPSAVGEGHSLFAQYTRNAVEALADLHLDRPSVALTRLGGSLGTGKTVALMEHARRVSVPFRVVFSTTGEWTATAAAPGTVVERPTSEGAPSQDEEARYKAFCRGVREAMQSGSRTMLVDLSGLNYPLPRGDVGTLGLTWGRIGMALMEAGPRFFEIIMDGSFTHPGSDGLPAVEGVIGAVARNARSRGNAAHIIYTDYGTQPKGLPDVRAHWEVRGWESGEPPRNVPGFYWDVLFVESARGRFWAENSALGGWDPVEVSAGEPVKLAYDRKAMRFVPAHHGEWSAPIDPNVPNGH